LGQQQRDENADRCGAMSAMDALDACCLGKAYVTAGIACGVGLGKGPGPVAHTSFPSTHEHFPVIALDPSKHDPPPFQPMKSFSSPEPECQSQLGKVLPIVDTVEWVERLCHTPGVTDIQLRFKDLPAGKENSPTTRHLVLDRVKQCQKICQSSGVRLWINDFWQAAVEAGCFGVHLGQEDLVKCIEAGGLQRIRDANMALGISTHTFGELAAALGVRPSYISLGPIFKTSSKSVGFDPQGLWMVTKWRQLIPPNVPLVTIGGISDASTAKQVREAGADCVAVIGAATQAANLHVAVSALNNAMEIHS
jgi:thiamine-phosphate diphosphorylase